MWCYDTRGDEARVTEIQGQVNERVKASGSHKSHDPATSGCTTTEANEINFKQLVQETRVGKIFKKMKGLEDAEFVKIHEIFPILLQHFSAQ